MKITKKSMMSGETTTLDVNVEAHELLDYVDTMTDYVLIFRKATKEERIFMFTGITPKEYKKLNKEVKK
jgi:hypothetical protein